MTYSHVIYTVKGIQTGVENWGDHLRRWMVKNHPQIAVEELDWGRIGPFRLYASRLLPFSNWARMDWMADTIAQVQERYYPGIPYSIDAHSFGTFLTHGMLSRREEIRPAAVVLIGSVLPERFHRTDFPKIIARGQVGQLLNVHSRNDSVIRLGSFGPFGKAGWSGFLDLKANDSRVRNVATEEEHSTYFWSEFRDRHFTEWTQFAVWAAKHDGKDNPNDHTKFDHE